MEFGRPKEIIITNAGGTIPITVNSTENYYVVTGTATLANDCSITFDVSPPDGSTAVIEYRAIVTVGVKSFSVLGTTLTANQALKKSFIIGRVYGGVINSPVLIDLSQSSVLETAMFVDKCITLAKMADATRGMMLRYGASGVIETFVASTNAQILIGDGTDIKSVAQSGNVLFSNTGQSTIQAGVIIDAMIAAGAAIARSKVAVGTANHVVINSNAGALSSEAQLSALRGGSGIDNSSATGFPIWASGAQSVGAKTETIRIEVSFLTAGQGTYYKLLPFPCTVTAAKARVTSALSGTDDGTIQLRNNGGTNMASGLITIPLSSAHGTAVAITPTTNNTFSAGEELQLVVAKATTGGLASVDITITRLTLS